MAGSTKYFNYLLDSENSKEYLFFFYIKITQSSGHL